MNLPLALPAEVFYYFIAAGALCVAVTAVGAILRLWGWKWIQTVAGVFIVIGLVVIAISWVISKVT